VTNVNQNILAEPSGLLRTVWILIVIPDCSVVNPVREPILSTWKMLCWVFCCQMIPVLRDICWMQSLLYSDSVPLSWNEWAALISYLCKEILNSDKTLWQRFRSDLYQVFICVMKEITIMLGQTLQILVMVWIDSARLQLTSKFNWCMQGLHDHVEFVCCKFWGFCHGVT